MEAPRDRLQAFTYDEHGQDHNTVLRVRRLEMKLRKFPAGLVAVIAISAVLAMCGKDVKQAVGIKSGNGGGNNGGTGVPAVSWGVMKKGSVIVNGVTFDPASAEIIHDDSPASDALLQDGMSVKVKGRLNADNVTGAADKIRTDSEVRGTIVGKGVDSITLLDQQVFADSRTVFANVESFQTLTAGQWVEVHGMRDAQDRLLATRIEVLDPASGPPSDRLKGAASTPFTGGNPPALTFTLRGLTVVTTAGTLIQPAGATINSGDSVKVHGFLSGTTFTAGRIDREDLENVEFEPQETEEFKVEGFVSRFTTPSAGFSVGQISTRLTGTTRFKGGVAADLANNVRVEAEGHMAGGVLTADQIKFGDADSIVANADAAGSANVLGKTVIVTNHTELINLAGGVAGITSGKGLKVRGFANPDGTITATVVEQLNNPVAADKIVVQGVVATFNASARTVSVLGITVNAAGATEVGLDNQPLTLDQLFAQMTAGRTIVKASGAFSAGPPPGLTASGIDIE
jgi:uncharacterized protein DUF5666